MYSIGDLRKDIPHCETHFWHLGTTSVHSNSILGSGLPPGYIFCVSDRPRTRRREKGQCGKQHRSRGDRPRPPSSSFSFSSPPQPWVSESVASTRGDQSGYIWICRSSQLLAMATRHAEGHPCKHKNQTTYLGPRTWAYFECSLYQFVHISMLNKRAMAHYTSVDRAIKVFIF